MATNGNPRIVLRSDIPDWLVEWLLESGYAESVETPEPKSQGTGLRSFQPEEADYVLGKSGPKTDKPE